MPYRLSEIFGIPQHRWDATGAFDAFVGVDARLHIDPHLLSSSGAPEFRGAREAFDRYFSDVVKLLQHAERGGGPFYAQALRQLTFREIPNTGLGYSKAGKSGSGIGGTLAANVAELGKQIVDAGIADPDIFSLMGLLQDGIGADRISDMTAVILLDFLLAFSERVVAQLGLSSKRVGSGERIYSIPAIPRSRESLLLVPRDILRHLPVAESWYDIDTVASHNELLRNRVNKIIGYTWRHATRLPKRRLRETLLKYPELLRDLLDQYKRKVAEPYDLTADPAMLYLWQPVAREVAAAAPLHLALDAQATLEDTIGVVRTLLGRFKELVESNRLYRLLYNDDGTPRREKAAQLALFGVADAYCAANGIDLSPETDSGNGPVDFKFSRGYVGRILAEVKLSTNSKLLAGFDDQIAAYEAAERAYHSFYVVLRIDNNVPKINRLSERYNKAKNEGARYPELVIIDARPTQSASKR